MQRKKNKQQKLHIKKGDTVKVLAGNSKGKEGEVLMVIPDKYRAIVKDVNIVSKHIKPSASNLGERNLPSSTSKTFSLFLNMSVK